VKPPALRGFISSATDGDGAETTTRIPALKADCADLSSADQHGTVAAEKEKSNSAGSVET
jgi:hypothetical protein